jgi:hypothetical protein
MDTCVEGMILFFAFVEVEDQACFGLVQPRIVRPSMGSPHPRSVPQSTLKVTPL